MEPLNQEGREIPVHCTVCLSTTGEQVTAAWITEARYLLCDEHKDIDMPTMIKTVWRSGQTST